MDAEPAALGDPETLLAMRQTRRRVLSVFRALPERHRQCLLLRAEGLRYREIASVLDISLGGVAKAIAHALLRLSIVVEK
jgi:RNA polymerase sigma-70 factor (ECF subfamily)